MRWKHLQILNWGFPLLYVVCILELVIRALGGKYNLHFCECLINGIHGFNFLLPPPTVDCLLLGCNGIIHEFELDSARFCGCYNYYILDIARRWNVWGGSSNYLNTNYFCRDNETVEFVTIVIQRWEISDVCSAHLLLHQYQWAMDITDMCDICPDALWYPQSLSVAIRDVLVLVW